MLNNKDVNINLFYVFIYSLLLPAARTEIHEITVSHMLM